jgi:hypothetical protein
MNYIPFKNGIGHDSVGPKQRMVVLGESRKESYTLFT